MQDVTKDRHKYIGGSDIPIIMGISRFKKRFDLLLEKAEIAENDFQGNEYTEYGNVMEPKIRDHINNAAKKPFKEDKVINEDLRYHADGFNGDTVLEIKTTSQIYDDVNNYKEYLAQLVFGMKMHGVKKGKLAVYERPDDFSEDFKEERLTVYDIKASSYKELLEDINSAIYMFREDLKKVKENPFITEEELQPKELIVLSGKVVHLENKIAELKKLESEYKATKEQLFAAMEQYNVKKWTTNNGAQITRVLGAKPTTKTVEVFDEERFKTEHAELYASYMKKEEHKTKERAGYVKITLPKGE